MRIVAFGGSFDPVHLGHEAIADAARAALRPDRILWIPAGRAPHKEQGASATAADRTALLRLVLARRPGEELDERELRRAGASYTVDTLRELRAEHPAAQLHFLLGADSLQHLGSWRDLEGLFGLAEFVFAPRPGWGKAQLEAFRASLTDPLRRAFRARWLDMPEVRISSTEVRADLALGRTAAGMRPEACGAALARGLYR